MRRLLGALTCISLSASASLLHAQDSLPLPGLSPGARVRIDAPGVLAGRLVTTVIARSRDTVTVRARERYTRAPGEERLASLAVPIDRITHVEVSRGRSRLVGAVVGAVSGAALGLAAATLDNRAPANCVLGCENRPSNSERLRDVGTIGAVAGSVVGLMLARERWRRIDLSSGGR